MVDLDSWNSENCRWLVIVAWDGMRFVYQVELISREPREQVAFPDPGVSDEDNWKQTKAFFNRGMTHTPAVPHWVWQARHSLQTLLSEFLYL